MNRVILSLLLTLWLVEGCTPNINTMQLIHESNEIHEAYGFKVGQLSILCELRQSDFACHEKAKQEILRITTNAERLLNKRTLP